MSEVRVNPDSTIVITSENAQQFYAKKLDIATEAEVKSDAKVEAVKTEEKKEVAEVKTDAVADPEDEVAEKRPKIARRFSELTGQRDAAKADTVTERTKREALERELAELKAKHEPAKVEAVVVADDDEPKPEDYKDAFDYNKALVAHGVKKALAERDAKDAENKAKEEQEKSSKAWQQQKTKMLEKIPDYDEVVDNAKDLMVSNVVRDAIRESDVGHELLYYLAKNPAEVERLKPMNALRALRELGKIEDKISKPAVATAEVKEEKQAAQISQAAPPITPLKGNNAPPEVPINSKGEFTGTYAQWREGRKSGKIH